MKLGKIGVINAPQPEPISLRCYTGNYKAGGPILPTTKMPTMEWC